MVRFFDPGSTYRAFQGEFDEAYHRVMGNGDLILRRDVEEFEKKLAEFCGTKYAVALNSGTDALYLALRGLRIGPGDEVIVPSRTFVATAQVVVQLGATPVYYDTDEHWATKITHKTAAFIPVHIEGAFGEDMEDVMRIADRHQIFVVEDACQALGATQNERKSGSFGIAGAFSFYPAKILGAFGDAGGLVTNDDVLYEYVREARNHFKETNNDWGVNSRMDNLQAAFLNVRFNRIEWMLQTRQDIADTYTRMLSPIKTITCPPHIPGRVWQDYIIRVHGVGKRDELYDHLKRNGIETMKNNYPFPVPKLDGAQEYEDKTLRLPCNENLNYDEVKKVAEEIKRFYAV